MAKAVFTRDERDAVLSMVSFLLAVAFLGSELDTGADMQEVVDTHREEGEQALARHDVEHCYFELLALYDDLRGEEYEHYPLTLSPELLSRVLPWFLDVLERLFLPALGEKVSEEGRAEWEAAASQRVDCYDLADELLDARAACERVLAELEREEAA